jgi:hypothetical protein
MTTYVVDLEAFHGPLDLLPILKKLEPPLAALPLAIKAPH